MLDTLYLQLESCMNRYIDSISYLDDKEYYNDDDYDFNEETDEIIDLLIHIIDKEIEELLNREKFININQSSKQYHTQMIYISLKRSLYDLAQEASREYEQFDLNSFKQLLDDQLEVFVPNCHLPKDYPYQLKEALLDDNKDNGIIDKLTKVIEKHYSMKLLPYLARRNISSSYTYKKGGSNYDYYLSIVNVNVVNGLKNKALRYDELTEDDKKIFQSNGRIINYIKMTIEHNGLPKADNNGMYKDEYAVFDKDVDIDSLRTEEGTVDKDLSKLVVDTVNQYKALQQRNSIVNILKQILQLNNKPHHTLTFLDMTVINKGIGIMTNNKTKTPTAKQTLDKYHDKTFYKIKELVQEDLNKELIENMNISLEDQDYHLVSYKLAHEKPRQKPDVIGTYTMAELSPTVTNITKWDSRIREDILDKKGEF